MTINSQKYVAFLRGINVGGHHKAPMADLRAEMKKIGFDNISTMLNSGNIIFETRALPVESLEQKIRNHLENHFGFSIPTIIRKAEVLFNMYSSEPFSDIALHKDIRLYISFLENAIQKDLKFPWTSEDQSFRILDQQNGDLLSILDLSVSKTPKAMEVLEQWYGKNMTTRNWNTIGRVLRKCGWIE